MRSSFFPERGLLLIIQEMNLYYKRKGSVLVLQEDKAVGLTLQGKRKRAVKSRSPGL